jgi:preprotein translocase subunit SecA
MPAAFLQRLLNPNEREVRRHLHTAEAIGELEPELEKLDDAAITTRARDLRRRAEEVEDLDELLIGASP